MPTLTKRQKQIFDFIEETIRRLGSPPTFEEIKKHLGLSAVSTVHQHIQALIQKGWLTKEANIARGVELKQPEMDLVQVPLIGSIAAGYPIEAIEEQETIAVASPFLKRGSKYFALKVRGNSMINEHIHDRDLILVRKQNTATNGDRVVALINNHEATLKRFHRDKDVITLEPANPEFKSIVITREQDLKIQGIVVGIIKGKG